MTAKSEDTRTAGARAVEQRTPGEVEAAWRWEIAPVEWQRFCRQPFQQAHHLAQSACIRCEVSERIHLRMEAVVALAAAEADKTQKADELLKAKLDAGLQRSIAEERLMSIEQLRTKLAAAEADKARLTEERDNAWGELGFTKNDLRNARHFEQQAEAKISAAAQEIAVLTNEMGERIAGVMHGKERPSLLDVGEWRTRLSALAARLKGE